MYKFKLIEGHPKVNGYNYLIVRTVQIGAYDCHTSAFTVLYMAKTKSRPGPARQPKTGPAKD